MKKSTRWATLAFCFFFGIAFGLYYINRTIPVQVPDSALRAAIQTAIVHHRDGDLGLSESALKALANREALNTENMAILRELEVSGVWIKSLEGIQHCTSLTSLRLNHCGITDITPLAHFQSMRFLSLNNNQIADLSPLANWEGAYELGLNSNLLTDLTPLQNFHVQDLLVAFNQISDLSPIVHKELRKLAIVDNPLSPQAHDALKSLEAQGTIIVK